MKIVIEQMEPFCEKYAIWSTLYVQIADISFPGRRWQDATSSVLCIWLMQMTRLLAGSVDRVELPFMDGDYSIKLLLLENGEVLAQCIGPNALLLHEWEINLGYFVRQLLSAVGKIEREYDCFREEPQLRELFYLVGKLRQILYAKTVDGTVT